MKSFCYLMGLLLCLACLSPARAQSPQIVDVSPESFTVNPSTVNQELDITITVRGAHFRTTDTAKMVRFNVPFDVIFACYNWPTGPSAIWNDRTPTIVNDTTLVTQVALPLDVYDTLLTSTLDVSVFYNHDTLRRNKAFRFINLVKTHSYQVTPAVAAPGETIDVLVSGIQNHTSQSSPTVFVDFYESKYQWTTNFSEKAGSSGVVGNITVPANTKAGCYDILIRDQPGLANSTNPPAYCQILNDAFCVQASPVARPARATGTVYEDLDLNCAHQTGERGLNRIVVEAQPGPYYALTDPGGNYSMELPYGTYTLRQRLVGRVAYPTCDSVHTVTVTAQQPIKTNQDFADSVRQYQNPHPYFHIGRLRPGSDGTATLVVADPGDSAQHITVEFTVPDSLQVFLTYPPATPIGNNTYRATLQTTPSINGLGTTEFAAYQYIWYRLPASTPMGTQMEFCSRIVGYQKDFDTTDNRHCATGTVTNSYDPNDKAVFPAGDLMPRDSVLTYQIRFQNTGTDTAFTVIVRDTLPDYLDLRTMDMRASSHPFGMTLRGRNEVEWRFSNINLVDSNRNEPASHGFVAFSVKRKKGLPIGTRINNRGGIYFDFNTVVLTNTVSSLLADPTAMEPALRNAGILLYPNPVGKNAGSIRVLAGSTDLNGAVLELIDPMGRRLKGSEILNGQAELGHALGKGLYRYRILKGGKTVANGNLAVE